MESNEISMLERWAGLLEAGAGLVDSVKRLTDIPEYSEVFTKIACKLKSGGDFQEAILENKQYFSGPTVMLSRAGEYVENLSQTLNKAKDLVELIEKHKPDTKKTNEILLCYSLGTLINSGVPILDAFNNVADSFKALNHQQPEQALRGIHDAIRQGHTMSEPMEKIDFFSPSSVYLASVGEETGDLDKTLIKAADILEKEVKYDLKSEQVSEIVFYYGLGMFENAGIPNVRTFRLLEELAKKHSIGPKHEVLGRVGDDIEYGVTLEDALSKQYFPKELVERVSVAEEAGRFFDTVFLSYSDKLLEKCCSK